MGSTFQDYVRSFANYAQIMHAICPIIYYAAGM